MIILKRNKMIYIFDEFEFYLPLAWSYMKYS